MWLLIGTAQVEGLQLCWILDMMKKFDDDFSILRSGEGLENLNKPP